MSNALGHAARHRHPTHLLSALAAWSTALLVACSGGGDDDTPSPVAVELASNNAISVADVQQADVRLLTHTMPAWTGGSTNATTLLFTPRGNAPTGGWPIVAWAHGTTTASLKTCAPSSTLDTLDGGLTAEGFTSRYTEVIAAFVAAGYAVVAPDFEGIGSAAAVPYPYYNSASESRSLLAGVRAARLANPALSSKWMAVGHSEGGRGVLALQAFVGEAPELDFRGTVALAPFVSLAAAVNRFSALKAEDPSRTLMYTGIQNFFVGMLGTGLQTVNPSADRNALMGSDLAALMPTYGQHCVFSSFGLIAAAVAAKPAFDGFKPGWSSAAPMKTFLETNDPAAVPGFKLTAPTLIVQGTTDIFVLEPLTTAFVNSQLGRGAPLAYRVYPGSDHGSIVIDARGEVLSYLAARFSN